MWQYSRDMQIHLLITFPSGIVLHEPTSTPLDLHTAARLLLDMLDVAATSANNLRTKIEAWDRFQIDRDALFGPLATTHVIALNLLLRFSATEATLVYKVGKLLLHELFYFFHC